MVANDPVEALVAARKQALEDKAARLAERKAARAAKRSFAETQSSGAEPAAGAARQKPRKDDAPPGTAAERLAAKKEAKREAKKRRRGGGSSARVKVRASHILMKNVTTLRKVADSIAAGASFTAQAQLHSTCPSARKGGDLGWFGPGQMVPQFDAVVFNPAYSIGAVYGPIKTQFGHHLIVVTERPENAAVIAKVRTPGLLRPKFAHRGTAQVAAAAAAAAAAPTKRPTAKVNPAQATHSEAKRGPRSSMPSRPATRHTTASLPERPPQFL